MSRDSTEKRLEIAALTLLREEGVLAGLNLRAAADRAGVNRGNVYHYFGSRRQLLQSALRRRLAVNYLAFSRRPEAADLQGLVAYMFKFLLKQVEAVQLTAILVLDGDEELHVMAFHDDILSALRRLQGEGKIDPDVDLVALHVFASAAIRGYVLHRNNFVRQIKCSRRELDRRIMELFLRMLVSLSQTAPASEPEVVLDQPLG